MWIAFVLDTSVSMNVRTKAGLSYIDYAKSAVEHFVKVRSKSLESRSDRYFLVTLEGGAGAIKSGWNDNFGDFLQALKTAKAMDMSEVGMGLRQALDLLSMFRLVSSIDHYGQGRQPWVLEAGMVVLLTDGRKVTAGNRLQDHLAVPCLYSKGSELTEEPFRWDQRLFSIVLDFDDARGFSDDAPPHVAALSEEMGGRWYVAKSMRQLLKNVEDVVGAAVNGVVVRFESVSDLASTANAPSGRITFLRLKMTVGWWPIPEAFLPQSAMTSLPARTAHPVIRYTPTHIEIPPIPAHMPVDTYEVMPCAVTAALLAAPPNTCWPTFVANSMGDNTLGKPFGFLRAHNNSTVLFTVLPYNFLVLLELLDELTRGMMGLPTPEWRQRVEQYLTTVPPYYLQPLRQSMKRMGTPTAIGEHLDGSLSLTVSSYLKSLAQMARNEIDRLKAEHKFAREARGGPASQVVKRNSVVYKNVFDIPRDRLLQQLQHKRAPLNASANVYTDDKDGAHSVPIGQMSNYADYLARKDILRDPMSDDEDGRRKPSFGNPFRSMEKAAQRVQQVVTDEAESEANMQNRGRTRRRHRRGGRSRSASPASGNSSVSSSVSSSVASSAASSPASSPVASPLRSSPPLAPLDAAQLPPPMSLGGSTGGEGGAGLSSPPSAARTGLATPPAFSLESGAGLGDSRARGGGEAGRAHPYARTALAVVSGQAGAAAGMGVTQAPPRRNVFALQCARWRAGVVVEGTVPVVTSVSLAEYVRERNACVALLRRCKPRRVLDARVAAAFPHDANARASLQREISALMSQHNVR